MAADKDGRSFSQIILYLVKVVGSNVEVDCWIFGLAKSRLWALRFPTIFLF